jgi:hypothetical protein
LTTLTAFCQLKARSPDLEEFGQVLPFDVLKHNENSVFAATSDIVDLDYRRMGKPRGHAGLGKKRLDPLGGLQQFSAGDLDRRQPAELFVARQINAAQPPLPKSRLTA